MPPALRSNPRSFLVRRPDRVGTLYRQEARMAFLVLSAALATSVDRGASRFFFAGWMQLRIGPPLVSSMPRTPAPLLPPRQYHHPPARRQVPASRGPVQVVPRGFHGQVRWKRSWRPTPVILALSSVNTRNTRGCCRWGTPRGRGWGSVDDAAQGVASWWSGFLVRAAVDSVRTLSQVGGKSGSWQEEAYPSSVCPCSVDVSPRRRRNIALEVVLASGRLFQLTG